MANFVYKKAKESLLNGEFNLSSNSLKVLLIDKSLYTPNEDTDRYISDIPASAIKKRSNSITNVVNSLGVLDADNVSINDYSGESFSAIVLYQSGSSDSNSKLIFFIDTSSGLPFAGSNSDTPVTIIWSDSNTKILSI
jgi:hypothetical protein